MKKMVKRELKPINYVIVGLAIGMLMGEASFAGPLKPKMATGTSSTSTQGSQVTAAPAVATAVRAARATEASCQMDPSKEKRFPLDFFKGITSDLNGLTIKKQNNKLFISSSGLLNVCGGFEPITGTDADGNVTIQMVNKGNPRQSYTQYRTCLENDKETKEAVSGDEIDLNKIESKNFEGITWEIDLAEIKDLNKGAAIYYAQPLRLQGDYPVKETSASIAPGLVAIDNTVANESRCYSLERQITIQQSREEALQEIQTICRTGSADKIRDLRRSLGNYNSISDSVDKIRLALDAAYLNKTLADEKGVNKIYADMKTLEDRFLKEKDTLEEAEAEKLVKKYADLAEKLNKDFLDYAIAHIEDLMKLRETLSADEDKKRIEEIDEEIKNLNIKIGEFSKKRPAAYRALLDIEEKFALTDSARTIAAIHAKSHLYAQVYAGPKDSKRGENKLSFTQAKTKLDSITNKFEKNLDDWTDVYQVSKGSTYPLKKAERERTGAITKMNKRWYDYQQSESKKYNQYCARGWTGSVKNPIQCQNFMRGIEKRKSAELRKRDKDLRYIASRNNKLGKMGSSYNEYQRQRMAERSNDGEDDNDDLADYEPSFADTYPEYYATEGASSYDPNQYSMGVQGNMGNMMMNQGMYPQMINPQVPVQQGQYQLNWPTV